MCGVDEAAHHFEAVLIIVLNNKIYEYRFFYDLPIVVNNRIPAY